MDNSNLQSLNTYILNSHNNRKSQDIWFNNISLLFDPAYIFEIIPTLNMNLNEKVNALTRFAFFLSLLLTIVKQSYVYIYVFLIPVIISYIAYIFIPKKEKFTNSNSNSSNNNDNDNNDNKRNDFNINSDDESNYEEINKNDQYNSVMESALKEECQRPTKDNPLMNILPTDNFEKRKPACNITDVDISNEVTNLITDNISEKLYLDTNNILNKNIGERDFYTLPGSRIPNDQGSFAKWLYETPVSCAIGNNGILKQFRACAFNNKSLDELSKITN